MKMRSRTFLVRTGSIAALSWSAATLAATPDQPAAATSSSQQSADLQEVIVTGTRTTDLRAIDSPAPVQVLGEGALERVGQPDLSQELAQNVPAFTAQSWGGDAANNTLEARLRGVSPNDAMILINGKRRHGSGNLAILGENYGSPYQGGVAPDLSFIPVEAIDHVEVLTDGAAAQYGSDAIAGVINIILKNNADGGTIGATHGHYFDQGGETDAVDANFGVQPTTNSFLNFTADWKYHDHSNRGAIDPRVYNYAIAPSLPGYPYLNQIDGDAQYHLLNLGVNAGYNFAQDWQLYAFGTYGHKHSMSYENWRTPAKLPQVYPLGFVPTEGLIENDAAFTAGVKGKVLGDWNLDLSSTYGRDEDNLYNTDGANVSLYEATGSTPTSFHTGEFIATELTNDLDFSRDVDVGLAAPLNVAFGVEQRHNTYELMAGDYASRYAEGSQAFPGFSLTDAGSHSRDNEAVYLDLATSPVKQLKLDAAGRYEHYSDFGNATVGKFTARFDFNDAFALRGTAATGFRAPTLPEEYYSATNVSPTSAFVQLPPNSPAAALLGIHKLNAEKSTNFSVGFVAHPAQDMTLTTDAYQIRIDNRIVGSGIVYGTGNPQGAAYDSAAVVAAIKANGNTLDPTVGETGINIFSNGADTVTRGAESVFTYAVSYDAWGRVDWSLSGDYNETKIAKILQTPTPLLPQQLYDENAISQLVDESPKFRLVAGAVWTLGSWTVNLRESLYGPSSNKLLGDDGVWYTSDIHTAALTDIEVAHKFAGGVTATIGANNAFNRYPQKLNSQLLHSYFVASDNYAVLQYPSWSPFGFDGGYWYGKLSYNF